MKTFPSITLALLAVVATVAAAPLDTGFTYQGLLTEAGKPNPGKIAFEHYYDLYDSPTGGLRVAGPVTNVVEVTDGVFSTVIDFGSAVFDGTQYWLEIGVRPTNTPAFTTLAPRQPVRPTPYALRAVSAGAVADGGVANAALAPSAVSADKIAAGQVVKSLNGLADGVQLAVEGDLSMRVMGNQIVLAPLVSCFTYTNCYWNLRGNGNITEGTHFLGTVAGELAPLDFRVNNSRSLRHRFIAAGDAPEITGGYEGNFIDGAGSVIGGGGQLAGINQILGPYNTVSGGYSNFIGGLFPSRTSAIGGGHHNRIEFDATSDTIGGGETNTIGPYTRAVTIAGGSHNYVQSGTAGTIAGGLANTNRVSYGAIGGGRWHRLDGNSGVIAGGEWNWIQFNAALGVIGGGATNRIETDAGYATISGGGTNRIGTNSAFGVIAGGGNNVIDTNSPQSAVSGGRFNQIDVNTPLATISGGGTNRILTTAAGATVGGGADNIIFNAAAFATIPGGSRALARSYGQQAYASGSFASHGDAQAGLYVVRNTTTTNSGTGLIAELFLDGASRRIRVPADAAWTFEISIAARDAGLNSAAYLARGTIENNAGVTTFPVAPTIDTINEDVAAWAVQLLADNVNDALVIRVTGSVAADVRWVATVRTAEVIFP
jgi:hypothetical protein